MVDMSNWESVKGRVHERLISSEWQSDRICDMVHVCVSADVCRTWYVDLGDVLSNGAIAQVTQGMLQAWGVTLEELTDTARANDSGSYSVRSMGDVLFGMTGEHTADVGMQIVTNTKGRFGAAGILDREIQSKLSDLFPDGIYVLPSSVHEVIAISAGNATPDELAEMVRTINRSHVDVCDRLSDHVFRLAAGALTVAA